MAWWEDGERGWEGGTKHDLKTMEIYEDITIQTKYIQKLMIHGATFDPKRSNKHPYLWEINLWIGGHYRYLAPSIKSIEDTWKMIPDDMRNLENPLLLRMRYSDTEAHTFCSNYQSSV